MRRKSTRNAQKVSPEKPVKEQPAEVTPKTRRSKRRKRSPAKTSDSEDEVLTVTKRAPFEDAPDTTTKSHSPSDEETSQEPIWKVTSSEDVPKGEIQKLKICLTRPAAPDSPDKSKARRSKSSSQTEDDATSSEDRAITTPTTTRRTRGRRGSPLVKNDTFSSQDVAAAATTPDEMEEKKGKGKSKGKHKSKIDKSAHLNDSSEIQTNNEISENVQVTPQSPSIDKPVDNENHYKIDPDDKQNVFDENNHSNNDEEQTTKSVVAQIHDEPIKKQTGHQSDDDEDDEPLSVIRKASVNSDNKPADNADDVETATCPAIIEQASEATIADEETVQIEPEIEKPEPEIVKIVPEKGESESGFVESKPETIDNEPETIQSDPKVEPEPEIRAETPETVQIQSSNDEDNQTVQPEEKETEKESSQEVSEQVQDETDKATSEIKEASDKQQASPKHSEPEKEEIDSETTCNESSQQINFELNESGDVSMTDLSDEKYAPPKDPEPESEKVVLEEKQELVTEKTIRKRLKRDNELRKIEQQQQSEQQEDSFSLKVPKSVKWGKVTSVELPKINLDTIQSVCPQIDFSDEPDLQHVEEKRERRKSQASDTSSTTSKKVDRKVSIDLKAENEKPILETQISVESTTSTENKDNIIAFNRKISIVDDTASKLKPPPSPAKNPLSDVLYITNLVRPFTIKQLRELLERTGKIKDDGFWTDRIKSKCYVQYESVDEAEATRNALHGVQWPIGNGKLLMIDYATVEALELAKNHPVAPIPVAAEVLQSKENQEPAEDLLKTEDKAASREEVKRKVDGPVREWDIGKKDLQRDRSRSRERSRKSRRSPTPVDDFISRKQRKIDDAVPQKLMDDLFLKTKATPSIYWKPLSPEEIQLKQQQRLIRMEEHKRRMEERSKGRDMGRGSFRRRYD